jgi:type I restriction enzyme, S subunit
MKEDWIECELGEVCEINMGQSPPSSTYNSEKKGLPFFQGKAEFTDLYPVVKKWCTKPTRIANDGDILLSVRAPVGSTNIGNQECAIGRGLSAISYPYSNKIIWFYLKAIEQQLDKQGTGTTFRAVSGSVVRKQIFPLAPLPIQRAIVSKIEALFSDLDNGIANFKKAQEQLKIYRQAVLKKAFEGGFSITNEELRITNEENHSSDNLPKGWKWVKSGEFFSFVTSGSRGWAKYYSDRGSIFIRITNLNFDTLILDLRKEKIQYVNPPQNSEGLRTKVEEGDFLFSITGYLEMFAIAPKLESAFVNQHVSLCRPKDFFDKKYLAYWIIAKSGGHYFLNKNQKGAVKAGLNLDDLKNFPVPLPPTIEEQNQIVQEIEFRLSVCDKMEQSITESIEKAEALRHSILKKAFEGKLLSKVEIDLCKKEADYEPASELLKKIQAEKLAKEQEKKKPTTKKKGKK